MTLSRHVNAEKLEHQLLKKEVKTPLNKDEHYIFQYNANTTVPKNRIPEESADGALVYKYIQEDLDLDGIPNLNLASFVNTDIDNIPLRLISENLVKNLADNDEYPSLIEYQTRCISILSDMWHAPKSKKGTIDTVGTATTGSSEAILLAGLALKKTWQKKRRAAGKSTENPNILMASIAQVALEKFARYFDVENRTIPVNEKSDHLIDVSQIEKNIDENTIGIFVILGSTFTGGFEPVQEIAHLLDKIEKEKGLDIKIHVDGASGGFVAPFVYPHLKWDFAVDRVVSINTSGHKFGLTTAGLGWIVWKHQDFLPEELRFKLDYLGGVEETFTLNFSRPGFPVLHQYYNFLTFGREGYTKMFDSSQQNARLLSNFLEKSSYYEVVSNIHKKISEHDFKRLYGLGDIRALNEVEAENLKYYPGLPVVSFRFSKDFRSKYQDIPQSIVSGLLRNKGFIIPNYHLTPDEQEKEILRIVVRPSLGLNVMEKLMIDIIEATELLIKTHDKAMSLFGEGVTAEQRREMIGGVLLSIASNGTADLKSLQAKHLDVKGTGHGKHKRSYRGAC